MRMAHEEGEVECRMPHAMCVRVHLDGARTDDFEMRVAFWELPYGWTTMPEWTDSGFRFDADMGLYLKKADRMFLRAADVNTTYEDMRLVRSTKGNIAYRPFGDTGRPGMLICGELLWNHIRAPGLASEEENP